MKDFLIVGHGIAGAVLSQLLLDEGKSVQVLDMPSNNQSSSVAAGLYNPITGRKMVKTWLADELFPSLIATYRHLEQKLAADFIHDLGIFRPFVDTAEQNDWDAKRADEKFSPFIEDITRVPSKTIKLNDPFGGIHLASSGYVDIPSLMAASVMYLKEINSYDSSRFEEDELQIHAEGVSYLGESYRNIIYCNGLSVAQSKYFGWLPFRPVKGDIMIMEGHENVDKIYNRGIFILPKRDGDIKVGSTYKNHFETVEPTEEGKNELLEKLSILCQEDFKVKEVLAGVRPATKDRRPLIGKHPEYEHLYLFNGFGSKGVSLVPYFAHDFISHLTKGTEIKKEVNLNRYIGDYSNASNQ